MCQECWLWGQQAPTHKAHPAAAHAQIGEQLEGSTSNSLPRPISLRGSHVTMQGEQDPCSAMSDVSDMSDTGGDTLHFYGVYDGHGGTEAAQHCANRLHHHLSEALASLGPASMQQQNALCTSKLEGGVHCQMEWRLTPKGAHAAASSSIQGAGDAEKQGAQAPTPKQLQRQHVQGEGSAEPGELLQQLQQQQQQQHVQGEGSADPGGPPQQLQLLQQQVPPQGHAASKPSPASGCTRAPATAASVPPAHGQADHSSEASTELLSEPPSTISDFCSTGCDTSSSDPSGAC